MNRQFCRENQGIKGENGNISRKISHYVQPYKLVDSSHKYEKRCFIRYHKSFMTHLWSRRVVPQEKDLGDARQGATCL